MQICRGNETRKGCDWLEVNGDASVRVASVVSIAKERGPFSIVTKDIIITIIWHLNDQDDPYRSFPVRPMRLEVCGKDTASAVASNCSLLLRHIHPV